MSISNLKLGDKVKRIYTYEIRKTTSGKLYAHILDGSNFHLSIEQIKEDFKKL